MDEVLFGRIVDAPLDENGLRQAEAMAVRLAGEGDLMIETSPRRRTQQTAQAIARQSQAPVLITGDVDEIDFGRWSGERFIALDADPHWRQWNEVREAAATPAGDSIAKVQSRVARHLRRMEAAFPNRTIAIVTHAEIIRATLMWILHIPVQAYSRLEISPCSLSSLTSRAGDYVVEGVNERIRQ
jgi:broad specificity phosphatase PhoE